VRSPKRRSLALTAKRTAVAFVGLQLAALAAVVASYLVPNAAVLDALHDGISVGAITADDTPQLPTGGVSDQFGECVMFSIGLGAQEGDGWFTRAATSPNLRWCSAMVASIEAHSDGVGMVGTKKVRYWNGLSAIARPALPLVGANGLRVVAMLALAGSVAALASAVSASSGRWSAVALLGPIAATGDLLGLVQVFHHPLMLAVGFVGIAHLARSAAQDHDWDQLIVPTFVSASAYSFVDLMNFVPGLWVMSAGVVAACAPEGIDLRSRTRRMLATGLVWPAGYLSMWAGKWVWAAFATSWSSVANDISEQIRFRVNGATPYATGDFAAGLKVNVRHWLDQPLSPVVIALSCLVVLTLSVRAARKGSQSILTIATVASGTPMLILWLLVFNNHNEIHYWFEYRSLPIVLGVGLMAFVVVARAPTTTATPKRPSEHDTPGL